MSEQFFGKYRELGKTEARQGFLKLLNELRDDASTLAITDRGEKVAVIMGYKQFKVLMSALHRQTGNVAEHPFAHLISKVGDLDSDKKKIDALFRQSIDSTKTKG